jgi:predicted nuclease of predicted toxin-antitoxin system
MRFLSNENFPLVSVRLLRRAGFDIAAITEDSPGAKDSTVLTRAVSEQRVVLTFDRDYGELIYRAGLTPPSGIVYFRYDPLTPDEPA